MGYRTRKEKRSNPIGRFLGFLAVVVVVAVGTFTYVATNRLPQDQLSILSTFALAGCLGSLVITPTILGSIAIIVWLVNKNNGHRTTSKQGGGASPNFYVLPSVPAIGFPQQQGPSVNLHNGGPFERNFEVVGDEYVD